jgi:hypothetical protein
VRLRNPGVSLVSLSSERLCGDDVVLKSLSVLCAALCLFAPPQARCQDAVSAMTAAASAETMKPVSKPPSAETEPLVNRFRQPPASEITIEGLGSFGHYHLYADSWWSEIHLGGVEYDRHSWGYFLKAQMDYVAEIQPVVLLNQPKNTDYWGDPLSTARVLNPGVGIAPIGLRMMWLDKKPVKPYYIMKGGMLYFSKKALSQMAPHYDFSLQIGLGTQFHLTNRLDMRAGFSFFHFSDAFMVPSNPGLDSLTYTWGLSYHLGRVAQ